MDIAGFKFEEKFNNNFASLRVSPELNFAVCTAVQEYIPIEHFKRTFELISQEVEMNKIHFFLFDKRALRTFHQPSMEWYFSVWKPAMREKGLKDHFKILPDMEWFVKAVEAGKHEIFQKFGKEVISGISVTYVNTLEEAIEKVKESVRPAGNDLD
ncbi:MAG: hypothetical protein ACXVC6_03080 [Bacteroidia bacterium]